MSSGQTSKASSAIPHHSHYHLNHPPVPNPSVCGKIVFYETRPWCQKRLGTVALECWLPYCLRSCHSDHNSGISEAEIGVSILDLWTFHSEIFADIISHRAPIVEACAGEVPGRRGGGGIHKHPPGLFCGPLSGLVLCRTQSEDFCSRPSAQQARSYTVDCHLGTEWGKLAICFCVILPYIMDHGQRNDLTHNLSKVYLGLGWQVETEVRRGCVSFLMCLKVIFLPELKYSVVPTLWDEEYTQVLWLC